MPNYRSICLLVRLELWYDRHTQTEDVKSHTLYPVNSLQILNGVSLNAIGILVKIYVWATLKHCHGLADSQKLHLNMLNLV